MNRLKKFRTYFLILLAFFIVSVILEKGLIKQMYYDMTGTVDKHLVYEGQVLEPDVEIVEAKSTNQNGYITVTVKNTTDTYISESYIKVLLYSKSGVESIVKHMEIKGLSAGEERTYKLRFYGSYIKTYEISLEDEFADKDYILSVFGYEINTKDIFGLDLSNIISADSVSSFGRNIYNSFSITVKSIPWWGWLWAVAVIVGVW